MFYHNQIRTTRKVFEAFIGMSQKSVCEDLPFWVELKAILE